MLQYVMHRHVGHHVGYARYGAIETHVDAPRMTGDTSHVKIGPLQV